MTRPLVNQVDHIIIKVDHPEPVLTLLATTLQLPVSWSLLDDPFFASTGICAGNADLEITRIGPSRSASCPATCQANLCGIAFSPSGLCECGEELAARGIPHSLPVPFVQVGRGGDPTRLWTNHHVHHLGGQGGLAKASISLSRFLTGIRPASWMMRQVLSAIPQAGVLFDRAFSDGMVFFVEYAPEFGEDLDRQRVSARAALQASHGGPLGLEAVRGIVVGAADFEDAERRWTALLAPSAAVSRGVWPLGGGLELSLVPSLDDAFQTLVLQVTSLERASSFLAEQAMLGSASEAEVTIAPTGVHGLDIRLVEMNGLPAWHTRL